jgi:hypothetical protein
MQHTSHAHSALLRRADGLLSATVNGELLMMSVAQGKYFNLNGVGARIWDMLAQPTTLEAIVTTLTAEYAVDAETARREVAGFVAELNQRGMLAPADEPAA